MDEKELEKLYNAVSSKFDIGDFNRFKAKMASSGDRQKFYSVVSSKGFDLGDYNAYEKRLSGTSGVTNTQTQPITIPKSDWGTYQPQQQPSQYIKAPQQFKQTLTLEHPEEPNPKINIDPNDPVKSLVKPLEDEWKTKIQDVNRSRTAVAESTYQPSKAAQISMQERSDTFKIKQKQADRANDNLASVSRFVEDNTFGNGIEAREYAKGVIQKNGGRVPKDNETLNLALRKADEYKRFADVINNSGDFREAAINQYKQDNPLFADQMKKVAEEMGSEQIPQALEGKIISQYLYNNRKNIDAFTSEHPEYKEQIDDYRNNIITKLPEYGANVVGNEVSRMRQQKKMNNAFANFNTQAFSNETDQLAHEMYKDDPQKLKIYDEIVSKDKKKYIDTPAFLNAFAGSIKRNFASTIGSIRDITGTADENDVYEKMSEEANSVSANAKGWYKDLATMGDFGGLVAYMAAGGNLLKGVGFNPAVADKTMTGLTFLHDQLVQGEMKYPNDPLKANLSGIANTVAFMTLSNIYPSAKVSRVFSAAKPEIENIVKNLDANVVSKEVAKNQIVEAFKNALVSHGKGVGEMAGLTVFNQGLDKALGLKQYGQFHPEDELSDVVKTTAIGLTPITAITGVAGYAQRARLKDNLLEMAENPKRFESVLDNLSLDHPEMVAEIQKRKENLQALVKTKESLDAVENLTDEQKKQYLLHDANVRSLTDKINSISDEKVKSKLQKRIDESEKIKDKILDGKTDEKFDALPEEDLEAAKKEHEEEMKPFRTTVIMPDEVNKPNVVELKKPINESADLPRTEVINPEVVNKGVGEVDNGLQVDNSGSGEGVGDKKVGSDLVKQLQEAKYNDSKIGVKETAPIDIDVSDYLYGHDADVVEPITTKRKIEEPIHVYIEDLSNPYIEVVDGNHRLAQAKYNGDKKIKAIVHVGSDAFEEINKTKEPNTNIQPASEGEKETTPIEQLPISNSNEPPTGEEPPVGEAAINEGEGIGITHAKTAEIRKGQEWEAYETNPETFKKWDAEADQRIKEGKMPALLRKMERGEEPDHVEQRMMGKYIASLNAAVEKSPTDENLTALKKAVELSDIVGGQKIGKSLVARKGTFLPDDSLGAFMMKEMQAEGVDTLTDEQKAKVTKEYEEIKTANEELKQKITSLEEENTRIKAEAALAQEKHSVKKEKKDFKKEREDIRLSIKDKWNKAANDGTLTAVPIPYSKQLVAIAPDVVKLVRSYVQEGVTELADVVRNIHRDLKDVIPDIQEKDVHNIIAGEYNEKKKTRNELAVILRDLMDEAKLINQYEALQNGVEPKNEKQKIERNRKIAELQKKIKEHDLTKLSQAKSRLKSEIEKIQKQLRAGDFAKPTQPIKLDQEAKMLKGKLNELRQKRDLRLMQIEYANRTKTEKIKQGALEVLNVPRTIMSSMDFSAPLRQGLFAVSSHPRTSLLAAIEMFRQAFSQKRFDNWFYDLKEHPNYTAMQKSGLSIADPHDYRLSAKEEAFMNNLAEKIPVAGRFIKGSERAYVGFLNKLRVDLFNRFTDRFLEQGKTYENSPEVYKQMSSYINSMTGRGDMPKFLEKSAPFLNSLFFSPRLIASRVDLLTKLFQPNFYTKTPKEIRLMYLKDMAKFIGMGVTVLALAKLNGAEVEDDPRSSDFGKIRQGNTRWDIWGGFAQYIRAFTQAVITGEKKNPNTKEIKQLNGSEAFGQTRADVATSFFRGKLAPVPSMAWDFLSSRTTTGEEVTVEKEAEGHLLPLIYSDVKEAMKDKGVESLFTVGVPSVFGVGVQTYNPKPSNAKRKPKKQKKDSK